ncbi:MAG: GspH/FimT family pseudopilin [Gemmatimonadota bacterium]
MGKVRVWKKALGEGVSLPGLLVALAVVGSLLTMAAPAIRTSLEVYSMDRAASLTRALLNRARLLAAARREPVRIRLGTTGDLLLVDPADSLLASAPIQGGGLLRLDSVRIRPASLRFNARGQAAPGSIYLYRGRRGVRLVSNFLGRVRQERLSLP